LAQAELNSQTQRSSSGNRRAVLSKTQRSAGKTVQAGPPYFHREPGDIWTKAKFKEKPAAGMKARTTAKIKV